MEEIQGTEELILQAAGRGAGGEGWKRKEKVQTPARRKTDGFSGPRAKIFFLILASNYLKYLFIYLFIYLVVD